MTSASRRLFDVLRRSPFVLPLVITWLAFALRMYHLGFQSLWRDEVDALRFATQPMPDLLVMFTRAAQNGPIYFLFLRPWLATVGITESALRWPSVIFSTLAVPVTYVLLARLAGRKPALILALFMAVNPYQVWYGQEAKMYAIAILLVVLELWLTVLAVQTRRWYYWIALYALTGISVYTHFVAALAIPVQLIWILLIPGQGDTRPVFWHRLLMALAYLATLTLPYIPVLRWAIPMLISFNYRTGFAYAPLPQILATLAQVFTRGPLLLGGLPMLPAILAVASGAVLWPLAMGRGGWRLIGMLLTWLLVPPVALYLISFSIPLFTERYLIWTMPAFLALGALGIVVLLHSWRWLGLAVLGLVLALNVADTAMYQHTEIKSDFRTASQYVVSQRRPEDRIIFQIPYGQYTFAYYAGQLTNYGDGPFTNAGATEAEVDTWMKAQTNGAPAVWLLSSEAWLWDERGMTDAWLASHGTVTDRAEFPLVTVTRYELNSP